MDTRLAGIYLVLKELGGFQIQNLEDRVFVQKAIYLLQVLGVDLRFRFSWYLRGPYSKGLAQSVYEIEADSGLKTTADQLQLRPELSPVIGQLKTWQNSKPESITQQSKWFELLSSIHYIKHISQPSGGVTQDNINEHLRKFGKPTFDNEQIGEAWTALASVGLVENKQVDLRSSSPET